MENDDNTPIKAAVISESIIYTAIVSTTSFHIVKMESVSGATTIEMEGDKYMTTTGNDISNIIMRVDNSTKDLFLTMKMKTDLYGFASDYEAMFMKLNSSLIVQWFTRVHGLAASPAYEVLDMYAG